jgi:hypothetical protein
MLFCRHYFSPLNTFMRKGRIRSRIRIRTSVKWIRIQEDKKHEDPADPDPVPDPDPQHCHKFTPFHTLLDYCPVVMGNRSCAVL